MVVDRSAVTDATNSEVANAATKTDDFVLVSNDLRNLVEDVSGLNSTQINRAFENCRHDYRQALEQSSQIFGQQVRLLGEQTQAVVSAQIAALFEAIKRLPSYGEELTAFTVRVVEEGWFIDPNMSGMEAVRIGRRVLDGESTKLTPYFMEYYESSVNEIEQKSIDVSPHREPVLRDVFKAHKRNEYTLSVLPLIAQAEGVIAERHDNKRIFSKEGRRAIVEGGQKKWVNRVLEAPHPLWANERNYSPSTGNVNRHKLMHGGDWEYGTRENSLKAISFLSFACAVSY